MTEWGEFFDEHADYTVASGFYENRRHFSLEQLYQAFKARLMHEVMVDAHGLSHYGCLVDNPAAADHIAEEKK